LGDYAALAVAAALLVRPRLRYCAVRTHRNLLPDSLAMELLRAEHATDEAAREAQAAAQAAAQAQAQEAAASAAGGVAPPAPGGASDAPPDAKRRRRVAAAPLSAAAARRAAVLLRPPVLEPGAVARQVPGFPENLSPPAPGPLVPVMGK
jgi:hypothetical protein